VSKTHLGLYVESVDKDDFQQIVREEKAKDKNQDHGSIFRNMLKIFKETRES
jgi:hypothetical protein